MSRRLIASGGPWEAAAGYSRAVVVGDGCWVAGTTDAGPDGRARHPGGIGAQARGALATIEAALVEGGFSLADVVRVRAFVTDIDRSDEVIAVLGSVFGSIRPATTLVGVAALIDPSLLVEIEVDARRA